MLTDYIFRAKIVDYWEEMSDLHAAFNRTCIPGSKTAVFYQKQLYYYIIRDQLNRTEEPKFLKDRFMLDARAMAITFCLKFSTESFTSTWKLIYSTFTQNSSMRERILKGSRR